MTLRTVAVTLLTAFLLVVPGASTAHAKACDAPAYPAANGSFSNLTAKKTTCAKAAQVAIKHYKCRVKNGPAGRCVTLVKGYACQEVRTTLPTGDITADVKCSKNQSKVNFTFSQSPG